MYLFGIKFNFWLEYEFEFYEGFYIKRVKIVFFYWYYVNFLYINVKIKYVCSLCKNWYVIL